MQIFSTLADFAVPWPDPDTAVGYCDVSLKQQLFSCSREGAEQLQLNLEVWMLSRDAYYDNIKFCSLEEENTCSLLKDRSSWVNGLNLNTSDPSDDDVKSYLDCIV